MTDERVDAEPESASPESVEPDEDLIQVAFDEILARQSELEERNVLVYDKFASDKLEFLATPEQLALFAAVSVYSKAFVEALAKRHADGVANLVRKLVRRKGKPDETRIGVADGSAATIAITADTPDEARLALLDLDVTADAVRGKVLRWDSSASAWRPAGDNS